MLEGFLRHEATTAGKLRERAAKLLRLLQSLAQLAYVRHKPSGKSRSAPLRPPRPHYVRGCCACARQWFARS